MNENLKQFILACSLPLLSKDLVKQFRYRGEKEVSKRLIEVGLVLELVDKNLSSFLKLLYNPQQSQICNKILVD